MLISELVADQLSRDELTRLLFVTAPEEEMHGDCIFVFGSGGRITAERVKRAVELFSAGRASHILFSGGTRWGLHPQPEAVVMRDMAVGLGVPEPAILIETESNHTKENVLASLLVLDRHCGLYKLRRLLVVSAPWHMRRCLLTLRTYMPAWIQFSPCPDRRLVGQAHNWWESELEARKVKKEAASLIQYVREGQLADEELDAARPNS